MDAKETPTPTDKEELSGTITTDNGAIGVSNTTVEEETVSKDERYTARELEIAFCIGMLNQKDLDIDKLSDQLNHAKFDMVKDYIKSLRNK